MNEDDKPISKNKQSPKPVTAVRISPDKRREVEALGINMTQLLEMAMDQVLATRRCPFCNQCLEAK